MNDGGGMDGHGQEGSGPYFVRPPALANRFMPVRQ
jgi:hypothetical protein